MAIIGGELNYYQAKVNNDTASNGGRISTTIIPSGLKHFMWPSISEAQLIAGATQWRKGFVRIDNAANEVAAKLRIGLWRPTPGSDRFYLAKGTQTNIQSSFGSPDLYGCGKLDLSVTTGGNTIKVLVEDGTVILFRNGGLIRISDETTLGNGGNAEVHTIAGIPSVTGDVVTLTIAGTLAHDYSSANTYVSSLIEESNVAGTTSGKVVISAAGTFNANLMEVGNLGSIYQTLTFTFATATTFTCTSDEGVLLPGGTTGNTYAPTHVSVGASYCSVPPACWGGVYAPGDTVTITTIPPCVPVLEKRVVPAGSPAIATQERVLMFFVES